MSTLLLAEAATTQIPASPGLLVALAVIAAIPIAISSVASVISALNGRKVVRETKTNSGSSMKDDLLLALATLHRMEGTQGLIVDTLTTHIADGEAHAALARSADTDARIHREVHSEEQRAG